jgi:eukaryotic-like serine/threonine-protein kinase
MRPGCRDQPPVHRGATLNPHPAPAPTGYLQRTLGGSTLDWSTDWTPSNGTGVTRWPTQDSYESALRVAKANGAALTRGLEFESDDFGYVMFQGSAGYVYPANCGGRRYAFKVFSKHASGRRERHQYIHDHLDAAPSPIFVDFRFAAKGVYVTMREVRKSEWFPAVRMEWCDGWTLERALDKAVPTDYDAREWALAWLALLSELRRAHIAHGDLQHGNVIVGPRRQMRLVDYDGMFVPRMRGVLGAVESGHPAYQHPQRQAEGAPFDGHMDGVSGLVILTALAGATPALWSSRRDRDRLLLGEEDLAAPRDSEMLERLSRSPDPVPKLVRLIRSALANPVGACPQLDEAARLYGVTLPPVEVAAREAPRHPELSPDTGDGLLEWEVPLEPPPGPPTPPKPEPVAPSEPQRPPKRKRGRPALTESQFRTLVSDAAGLAVEEIAWARGSRPSDVRQQLARLAKRLDGDPPGDLIGKRLSRRQAEVLEMRRAGLSEEASAKRLDVQPSTVRRHLQEAIRRIDDSPCKSAKRLATEMRELMVAEVAPPEKPPPVEAITSAGQSTGTSFNDLLAVGFVLLIFFVIAYLIFG